MRRKDRERDEKFALEVLRDCEYATLATLNPYNTPYCIPISPVLIEKTVYFHYASEGKKLDNITNNHNICLSCVRHTKLIPENFSTEFESAVVSGKCELVNDETEKVIALRAICEKYASTHMNKFDEAISRSLHRTGICKIYINQITGKSKSY